MRKIIILITAMLFIFLAVSAYADSDVTLAWDPNSEADLAGYKIYVGNNSGQYGSPIDVGNVTTFTVTALEDGVWYFAATAYDTDGNESGFSNEVSATLDSTAPNAPQNLRITIVVKTQ